MLYLAVVTFIWAISFGLIGSSLKGVDPFLVATLRLACATLFISPFHSPQESRGSQLRDANHLRCDPVRVDVYFLHEVL